MPLIEKDRQPLVSFILCLLPSETIVEDAMRKNDGFPRNTAAELTIGEVMNTRVVTVEKDDTLRAISGIFAKEKFHHILVVQKYKLQGIISDRDVLKAMTPFLGSHGENRRDVAILDKCAYQIMSRLPVTIAKETPIDEAVDLCLSKNLSCLPVVSPEGDVEGIVTLKDLIKIYYTLNQDSRDDTVDEVVGLVNCTV